jgi:hypothetical protein
MQCNNCGGTYIEISDDYKFESLIAGTLWAPDIHSLRCSRCTNRLLAPGEHKKILDYVRDKESELISQQPISHFISAGEAASMLAMTKQAFSKNKKIIRGFILFTVIDDRKYYLKKSVEQFKLTGDGRICLVVKEEYSDPLSWGDYSGKIIKFRQKEPIETTIPEGAFKYE